MVQQLDFAILNWIQSHLRCAFLDALMPKVTLLAEYGIVLILLGMVLLCAGIWQELVIEESEGLLVWAKSILA